MGYEAADAAFYWGTGSTVVDLTDHLQGDVTLQGRVVAPRARRKGSGDGLTADAVSAGLALQATVFLHADTAFLLDGGDGFVWIEDTDPGGARVTCFQASIAAIPLSAASDAFVAVAAQFTQSGPDAVEGARISTGNVAPTTGDLGFVRGSGSIVKVTASTALTANQVGVRGVPLRARNS